MLKQSCKAWRVATLWLLGISISSSWVEAEEQVPAELQGIDIVEKVGARMPLDLSFRNQNGQSVRLGDYLDKTHPVILVLAYYQCPMLCSLVLNGVLSSAKLLEWTMGKDYRVVTISFDPRDTVELAQAKRATHIQAYGRVVADKGWDFLLADEVSARTLADVVGFRYRWDEATQQFAHAAGIFILTPAGQLARTLYGISYRPQDLRLALVEATEGKLGNAWDKILLFCFHYDPNARNYTVATLRLMRISGIAVVLVLGIWLMRLWRAEKKRTDGALRNDHAIH